jgi:hypothetical protein
MGKVRGHTHEMAGAQNRPAAPDVVTAGAPLGAGGGSSVPSARERLRSRELTVKVFVAGVTYVALAPITQLGAIVGVMVSPILSDLVKDYVERHRWSLRRLRRGSAAAALLGHEEEAYASRRRAGRGPSGGIPGALMASVAAMALVIAGIAASGLGGDGHTSAAQPTASNTTTVQHPGAPDQVIGLDGVTPTADQPVLTWTAVPGARRYVVFRNGRRVSTQTAPEFRDPTASLGVLNYRVAALAHGQRGPRSRTYTIVYQATPPPAPDIDLRRTGPTTDPPSFAWNQVPGAAEYVVYRDGSRIDPTTTATSFTDRAAAPGIHRYQVAWIRAGVESLPSNALRIEYRPEAPPPPPPPTGLSGPKVTADPPVLTWTGVDGADGYTVYRDDQPVSDQTGTSFTDVGATDGPHSYYVTARTGGAESVHSNVVRIMYVPRLPFPSGIHQTSATTDPPALSWDPVAGASAYNVYRDGGFVVRVQQPGFSDDSAPPGTHDYTVSTVNRIRAEGTQSAPAVAITYDPPPVIS